MSRPGSSSAPSLPTGPLGERLDLARWYDSGHRRFRIPALTQTPEGTLLAVFDVRPTQQDLPAHIGLAMRRSHDDGRSWGPLQPLHADVTWSFGDPSLLVDRTTGRLFCFAASSITAGFWDSRAGTDPEDGGIMHADVLVSDDDGLTWHHRRLTEQVKDPSWTGLFAASGEGIQLRRGPHAGRLLQQYVARIGEGTFAVTAYSDDHGETWHHGDPVGPGADENKVVECSDGSVLLNTRARPRRMQARSRDGGAAYGELAVVPEQVDPANNGAIVRVFPDASTTDPLSGLLALSHTADPSLRRDLTVRFSPDDGHHWTSAVLVETGPAEYSTLTPFGDGRLGLLYEREGYATLSYRTVDVNALPLSPLLLELVPAEAGSPAEVPPPGRSVPALDAGGSRRLRVRATNLGHVPIADATVALEGEDALRSDPVAVGPLAPGAARAVELVVEVPEGLAGPREVLLRAEVQLAEPYLPGGPLRVTSQRPGLVEVQPGGPPRAALAITAVFDAAYPEESTPHLAGDRAVPWVRVRNSGSVPLTGLRVRSAPDTPGTAIEDLAPGASATVSYGEALMHTLTVDHVSSGTWAPTISVHGTSELGDVAAQQDVEPVDLRHRPPHRKPSPVLLPTGDLRSSALWDPAPWNPALCSSGPGRSHDQEAPAAAAPVEIPSGTPLAFTLTPGITWSAQLLVRSEDSARFSVAVDCPRGIDLEASVGTHVVEEPAGGAVELSDRTADLTRLAVRLRATEGSTPGTHPVRLWLLRGGAQLAVFPLQVTLRDVLLAPRAGQGPDEALVEALSTRDPGISRRAREDLDLAVARQDVFGFSTVVRIREEALRLLETDAGHGRALPDRASREDRPAGPAGGDPAPGVASTLDS